VLTNAQQLAHMLDDLADVEFTALQAQVVATCLILLLGCFHSLVMLTTIVTMIMVGRRRWFARVPIKRFTALYVTFITTSNTHLRSNNGLNGCINWQVSAVVVVVVVVVGFLISNDR
jgi:hypothetical protein